MLQRYMKLRKPTSPLAKRGFAWEYSTLTYLLTFVPCLQAGIIFTLLGAAADEAEEQEKKMKKGDWALTASLDILTASSSHVSLFDFCSFLSFFPSRLLGILDKAFYSTFRPFAFHRTICTPFLIVYYFLKKISF